MKFRIIVGLTFWPMTAMNVSFTIMGSMLAPVIYWDRVLVIALIYALALGVSAHALDARYSKKVKPWGSILSNQQLEWLSTLPLLPVIALGIYIAQYSPLIVVIAIAEFFFLFAYNMELFKGKFHNDLWFALSWGMLPLWAGFVAQTNGLYDTTGTPMGLVAFLLSYVEINASRPYKSIKRVEQAARVFYEEKDAIFHITKYENILKGVVALTVVLTTFMVLIRAL